MLNDHLRVELYTNPAVDNNNIAACGQVCGSMIFDRAFWNIFYVRCDACKATKEYKDALYELEIGFDGNHHDHTRVRVQRANKQYLEKQEK